jgi:predicted transposase YbfD/YdcC
MSSNLIKQFSTLTDPRSDKNKLYDLTDILVLSICAIISGADGWEAIERFGNNKLDWLRQYIKLENGIPSHDCISWVFSLIPPKKLQECFVKWTEDIVNLTQGEVVSIDGKTARRSYDKRMNCPAIHMVSAWANNNGMSLGQVATEEKSNEITAIPELLEMLVIKGCIVTIDAMGCQKTIAKKIIKKEADYVLAVKDNQKFLHKAIIKYFETSKLDATAPSLDFHEEIDHGHGRTEIRRYWLSDDLTTVPKVEQWEGLCSIGLAEREYFEKGKRRIEQRHYIVSFKNDAKAFGHAVRKHWGVENSLHWVLDVVFREDDSRIRRGHSPVNFNTLRQISLNLLKKEKSKISIKQKRFESALNDGFRAKVVF